MRRIMGGAASGSSSLLPRMPVPLVTVSRLVPSLSISASSPACDDADSPSTATIAATPMAMPSADNAARNRRVRTPTLATRATSAGRSRAGASTASTSVVTDALRAAGDMTKGNMTAAVIRWRGLRRRIGHNPPVADVDAPGKVAGHVTVVGDHHDRGAPGVELFEHGHDGRARTGVEVARRLV